MDFLNSIRDAFSKKEEVPMAAGPSIVKLGEGETIVDPSAQPMHPAPQYSGQPNTVPKPVAAPIENPIIPIEQNETLGEAVEAGVPVPEGYEEYTDGRGRKKLRRIADVIPPMNEDGTPPEGYEQVPNARGTTMVMKPTTVPETEVYEDGRGRKNKRRRKEPRPLIGSENQGTLTEEEAAVVDEAVKTIPDPATTPDAKPTKVRTPDGGERVVTQADVNKVAEEDPSGFSKAMSWVTRTLGVTGQDLARFAVLYAGSRVAGYDHQGSMSWSFGVAGEDLVKRRSDHNSMAATGKFDPESLEIFKKTGDYSKLKYATGAKAGTKIDYTKPKFASDGKTVVYPATTGDGTKVHVTSKGKTYTGFVSDPEDPTSNKEIYEKYQPKVASIAKEMTKVGREEEAWYTGSETADAALASEFALEFALENGIPPDSAAFANITRGAYMQAKRWAQATGNEVNSIQPFLDQQKVYQTSNQAWAGALKNKNGEKLNVEEFGQISNSVMNALAQSPQFEEAAKRADRGTMISWAMKALYDDYEALSPEAKAPFTKRGGFHAYLQEATLNPFNN